MFNPKRDFFPLFKNTIMCWTVSDNSALAREKAQELVTSSQEDRVRKEKKWRCLEDLAQHSTKKPLLMGAATCQSSCVQFA